MGLAELGTLAALALVDSTSFGTLLIPAWLLMHPGHLRLGRVATYLATVTACYFAVGLALTMGAGALLEQVADSIPTRTARIAQLVIGVGLFAFSFALDSKKAKARAAQRARTGQGGRISRWRATAMAADSSGGALVALAVAAVLIELISMLPYLGAIGIITTQGPGWPGNAVVLAGYCAVMVAPAVVLTVGRLVAARQVVPPLQRLERWMTRTAPSTTAWIVGIVGVLLALDAISLLQNPAA